MTSLIKTSKMAQKLSRYLAVEPPQKTKMIPAMSTYHVRRVRKRLPIKKMAEMTLTRPIQS